ncbi:RNA polymerase recycling motor ATPase HelR [Pseudoclavibacter sp. VKM Ac-2867]|uniref:RNA polymerase recycling motor ATPase HelR n=1 Tax=Pseudoclavibacter sp. VKM Ac-2867 TaxID=2783829 RepID=UPI002B276262|nr:RNA polymerase recycling motor ATPase HelR [Pseudoclavibacter sp. VKM Ac-2867]
MTSPAEVFALPAHLSFKSDPELVGADAEQFAAVAEALALQKGELAARLDELRLTEGGAGQQALDRDTEIHRLSRQLRGLERFGVDACLGRMTPADGSPDVYVGRFGLADEAGRRLLIDWRVPAAEPFFAATHANPLGLASRRRYRWNVERVVDYWDEVFVPGDLVGRVALDDQSSFIASLGTARSGEMRDVLGTIQADQDAIIRAPSRGALVVDGGPGTGKTVVALHRTAFLLYSDPRFKQGRGGVLFVGPSRPYLNYVANVLPSLGEDSVQLCTLRDLLPEGADAREEADASVARLKSSLDLVRAVGKAVRYHQRPPRAPFSVTTTDSQELTLDARDWAEAFVAYEPGLTHNEAREQVWEEVLRLLVDKRSPQASEHAVRASLVRDERLRAAFAKAWPLLDPASVIADLWSVPAYLQWCAPELSAEQVRALQRADARSWTVSDLPLIDAARRLTGDPNEFRQRARRAEALVSQQENMSHVVDNLIEGDDDGEGVVTMLRVEDAQHSLIDEDSLPPVDFDELAGPFAHVVIDEAQELTDAEWAMLLARCPSRSFTVVGDRAQARHGFRETWEERLRGIGLPKVEVAQLTINYRTPEEVMAEAAPVILAALPDANVPVSVRSSGLPVVHGSAADLQQVLDAWLEENLEGIACVITAVGSGSGGGDGQSGVEFDNRGRVRSLTPETAKGLEFDLVVLVDPEQFGTGIEGAVDRYVAMTRATQRLVVLTTD